MKFLRYIFDGIQILVRTDYTAVVKSVTFVFQMLYSPIILHIWKYNPPSPPQAIYPFAIFTSVVDDPRRSAELYQVHEPVQPKEIQSQQRIRNKILFGKPQACKNMIRCGLFCSTFWADL
ncbi:hypothetical protein AVEN_4316-1 [Araneus ventricosus]|uniref:Uncharacterized protein n=1 Tax=Araneus ventricosus TaxID=182803 RepID=A0A4Y2GID6_ARAVE|nr:hypothetical protein AVEN_4316-1 [Araneus ventricosus]